MESGRCWQQIALKFEHKKRKEVIFYSASLQSLAKSSFRKVTGKSRDSAGLGDFTALPTQPPEEPPKPQKDLLLSHRI